MAVHTLASLTWPAVRDLPAEQTVAVLPTGAIEAHGPHLPLGTDIVIAEAMARAGAERLAGRGLHVLVLPSLPVAPSPFASEFPGTLHTPADATTLIVVAIVRSLRVHGIHLTAIANAHHDPAHVQALRAAVDEVAASGGGTLVFPDLTRRRWAGRLTAEFQSGACHAGQYEGSIVLAERPDLVRHAALHRSINMNDFNDLASQRRAGNEPGASLSARFPTVKARAAEARRGAAPAPAGGSRPVERRRHAAASD